MGKRVKQADGSYCYTVNCRIHDRLAGAPGAEAVIYDAETAYYSSTEKIVLEALTEQKPFLDAHAHRRNSLKQTSRELVENYVKYGLPTPGEMNYQISRIVDGDAADLTSKPENWEKMSLLTQNIRNGLTRNSVITKGDQVVVRATGQIGQVMEGSTLLGGRVRVHTEDGMNDFGWHNPADVVKLDPNGSGLKARQKIIATAPDMFISKNEVHKLLEEETNTVSNPHPFAYEGVPKESWLVVREELTEAGERFKNNYPHPGATRYRIIQFLKDEERKRRTWIGQEDVVHVKQGFQNIINYLESKPNNS